MSPKKLWIATPAYNGVSDVYLMSAVNTAAMMTREGLRWTWTVRHDPLVTVSRNLFVANFLAADHTHLLFIDSDIGWEPQSVFDLLESGYDVCCGIYQRKTDPAGPVKWPMNVIDPERLQCVNDRWLEILDAPTGFLMIARTVFEQMKVAYPDLQTYFCDDAPIEESYRFFDCAIEKGSFISEDFAFSRRWRQIGGSIWADIKAPLLHVGQHTWGGPLIDFLKPTPIEG